jgi:hypothetical protein
MGQERDRCFLHAALELFSDDSSDEANIEVKLPMEP